jgi:hypothetical protein
VYLVGTDIVPGKYRTDGGGYFALLKDAPPRPPTTPTTS